MSFWKKMFKKIEKKNEKFHIEEMEYFKKLEKKMKKLEKSVSKKKPKD